VIAQTDHRVSDETHDIDLDQLVLSHMLLPARCSSQESAIGSETSRKSSLGTTTERRFFFLEPRSEL
jgi:hypothetical protein